MGRKTLTYKQFTERANRIHDDKYIYNKSIYVDMFTKLIVTCPFHGDFLITPSNHLKEYKNPELTHLKAPGCPVCGKDLVIARNKSGRKTTEQFIKDAINIHSNRYEYNKVQYVRCRDKIEIICKLHGSFFQVPSNHLKGNGCPKCKNSKGQAKVSRVLSSMGIKYIDEHSYVDCKGDKSPLLFDFSIPSKNILIEYDGEQHFHPVKFHADMTEETTQMMFEQTQRYDIIKNKYAKDNNILLLRIPYTEFNNIERIIREFIYSNS